MIELDTIPDSWVVLILLAAVFGAFGGLAYQLLQSYRGDDTGAGGRVGWAANPFIGAVAAVAILYAFPPQVSTITEDQNGGRETSYTYDVVKLVSLSLIVGSAGGSILSTMQSRVLAQATEQKLQTAQQKVETTIARKDLEIAQVKAATPGVVRGMVQEVIADRAQPKIEEQLTAVANETTSKMIAELKSTGVVDDQQAEELVDKVRPTINIDKRVSSTQDVLDLIVNEAAVAIPNRVEERVRDGRETPGPLATSSPFVEDGAKRQTREEARKATSGTSTST